MNKSGTFFKVDLKMMFKAKVNKRKHMPGLLFKAA